MTSASNSQKSLTGRAIPCSCARLQRISEATEPPRWVWSSARPSAAGITRRALGSNGSVARTPAAPGGGGGRSCAAAATPARGRSRRPPARAPRPPGRTPTGMTGSREPCATAIGYPSRPPRSSSKPSTSGMNPESAMIAAGRGLPLPSPSAQLITAPCEKPPRTTCSSGTGSASRNAASGFERGEERLRIGRRDAAEPVPVRAARRQRERAARRDAEQPPSRVERVEERVEVVLVGPAAVQERRAPRRRRRRGALEVTELARAHDLAQPPGDRAAASGRARSPARRCSKAGGRISASPRWSASSSIEKPGPSVAISNRTPLGSRK